MKLTQLLKENEDRGLTSEVKKHFLEIVSTYNKYQESMERKSDIIEVAETLGGITEAARELALREADDWFDKHTIKRNMSELTKLGSQFDKVAKEARNLDQRMNGLYEDMGNILSRYYKIGEITEDEMKSRLGLKESKDCGCGCGGTTPGGCGDKSVNEGLKYKDVKKGDVLYTYVESGKIGGKQKKEYIKVKILKPISNEPGLERFSAKQLDGKYKKGKTVVVFLDTLSKKANESVNEEQHQSLHRTETGNIVNNLKEVSDLNEDETKLYEFGLKVEKALMNEKNCPTDPGKWAASKAAAKSKFKVYPSAYANGWAAKNYKGKGGGWRKCKG